jgi:phosphatidylglycerophosphatase C
VALPPRTVAAFDFDGTLTRRDTMVPFLARVAGWPQVVAAGIAAVPPFAFSRNERGDRDAAKARVFARLFRGRPYEPVLRAGEEYGALLVREKLRTDTRARLDWHRARGHEVVLVSASLAVYLGTVGRALGVDAVLSTELEVDRGGACTGRMLDGNCRGEEKARRLRAYLQGDDVEVWAYGDSDGDTELLAMADHPVRVRARSQETSLPAMPTA